MECDIPAFSSFFVNFDYEEPNSDGQLTIWQ